MAKKKDTNTEVKGENLQFSFKESNVYIVGREDSLLLLTLSREPNY